LNINEDMLLVFLEQRASQILDLTEIQSIRHRFSLTKARPK